MNTSSRQLGILLIVSATVLFTNLGSARLWDRDEPRNAGCAREMLARGDWVTPVFNSELRTHKPVLLYWLMMISYTIFGVTEFAARLPSAVLGMGTVFCTYAIGARLFSFRAGFLAGLTVVSSLLLVMAGRAATPDSLLIFLTSLTLLIYVQGTFLPRDEDSDEIETAPRLRTPRCYFPQNWGAVAAMNAVMGFGMLAKGPVGLVLPTAVMGMFLLIRRLEPGSEPPRTRLGKIVSPLRVFAPGHFFRTCWYMRPVTALAVSLAVALPWYIWVGLRTDGEFLQGFLGEHNFGRATQAMEGHAGSVLFYPGAILVGFFPWSILAMPLLVDLVARLRRDDPWKMGYQFAACWVCVFVGLFTIASTKLPSYVTPCYPGLGLLAGCYLDRWSRNSVLGAMAWRRLALGVYAVVGLVLVIAVPIAAVYLLPGEESLGLIGAIPLVFGAAAIYFHEKMQTRRVIQCLSISATLFTAAIFSFGTVRVDRHQETQPIVARIASLMPEAQVAAFGVLEPSWVFYSGRSIDELAASTEPAHFNALVERDGHWIRKPPRSVPEILETGDPCVFVTTAEHVELLQSMLPTGYRVLEDVPRFLKDGERLLLVGNVEQTAGRTRPAILH